MDPDAALANLREAVQRAEELADPDRSDPEVDALWDALTAARALDQWLSSGGFLPTAWQNRSTP